MSDEARSGQSNVIPLVEQFHSIQGEGFWVGTPMHFIRVAGCPVGSSATHAFTDAHLGTIPILQSGLKGSKCRTYDGRYFDCDTDLHVHERVSVEALLDETWEKHICLTGGEPLAHQYAPWFDELLDDAVHKGVQIHIETSGTINLKPNDGLFASTWITVAPKFGVTNDMIDCSDEIKLLVDDNFSWGTIPERIKEMEANVYLCSINEEKVVDRHNLDHCIELLKERPGWKLGFQLHKFLGVR